MGESVAVRHRAAPVPLDLRSTYHPLAADLAGRDAPALDHQVYRLPAHAEQLGCFGDAHQVAGDARIVTDGHEATVPHPLDNRQGQGLIIRTAKPQIARPNDLTFIKRARHNRGMTAIQYTTRTDSPFYGAHNVCEFCTRTLTRRNNHTVRIYIRRLTAETGQWETVTRDVTSEDELRQQRQTFIDRMEQMGWQRR